MRKFYKFFKFLTFSFVLFVFMSSPKSVLAAPINEILSSPNSLIVRIQERIESFFAFNMEQKIVVLEKQAERRLTQAENLAKTKDVDVDKVLSLIKSYETLKEKQGNLINVASTTVPVEVKEQTVQQQARIEDMKEDMSDDAKEIIEDSQRTVIKTMMDNIEDSGVEKDEVTEFAEEIKNVIDPGSNIFAPGTLEVAPGSPEVAPGVKDVKP